MVTPSLLICSLRPLREYWNPDLNPRRSSEWHLSSTKIKNQMKISKSKMMTRKMRMMNRNIRIVWAMLSTACLSLHALTSPRLGARQQWHLSMGLELPVKSTILSTTWEQPVSVLMLRHMQNTVLSGSALVSSLVCCSVVLSFRNGVKPELLVSVPSGGVFARLCTDLHGRCGCCKY